MTDILRFPGLPPASPEPAETPLRKFTQRKSARKPRKPKPAPAKDLLSFEVAAVIADLNATVAALNAKIDALLNEREGQDPKSYRRERTDGKIWWAGEQAKRAEAEIKVLKKQHR